MCLRQGEKIGDLDHLVHSYLLLNGRDSVAMQMQWSRESDRKWLLFNIYEFIKSENVDADADPVTLTACAHFMINQCGSRISRSPSIIHQNVPFDGGDNIYDWLPSPLLCLSDHSTRRHKDDTIIRICWFHSNGDHMRRSLAFRLFRIERDPMSESPPNFMREIDSDHCRWKFISKGQQISLAMSHTEISASPMPQMLTWRPAIYQLPNRFTLILE